MFPSHCLSFSPPHYDTKSHIVFIVVILNYFQFHLLQYKPSRLILLPTWINTNFFFHYYNHCKFFANYDRLTKLIRMNKYLLFLFFLSFHAFFFSSRAKCRMFSFFFFSLLGCRILFLFSFFCFRSWAFFHLFLALGLPHFFSCFRSWVFFSSFPIDFFAFSLSPAITWTSRSKLIPMFLAVSAISWTQTRNHAMNGMPWPPAPNNLMLHIHVQKYDQDTYTSNEHIHTTFVIFITHIGIRKPSKLAEVRNFLLPFWVFDMRRERHNFFLCWLFHLTPPRAAPFVDPNWSHLGETKNRLPFSRLESQLTVFFFSNSKILSTSGHDVIHVPGTFSIWVCCCDID